jgi:hypothetical protein
MKNILIWSRWAVVATILLLGSAWAFEYVAQWLLRLHGQTMLADIRSLKVGQSTSADAHRLLRKWGRWGEIQTSCHGDTCQHLVVARHTLPSMVHGNPYEGANNSLPMLIDLTGLRSAAVSAGFSEQNGVVTEKGFSEDVDLPARDWYVREGAYVPDLLVSANAVSKFRDYERESYVGASHPSRIARSMKGPWGLIVKFIPDESSSEQSALMDFRFSCITQFFPCQSEREVLPEGWQMVRQQQ